MAACNGVIFDLGGVEVFLDKRRGNFYVVKTLKPFHHRDTESTEIFRYKTDLFVEITITDTQYAILEKQ